jgi:hypothetical protein
MHSPVAWIVPDLWPIAGTPGQSPDGHHVGNSGLVVVGKQPAARIAITIAARTPGFTLR